MLIYIVEFVYPILNQNFTTAKRRGGKKPKSAPGFDIFTSPQCIHTSPPSQCYYYCLIYFIIFALSKFSIFYVIRSRTNYEEHRSYRHKLRQNIGR